MRVIALLKTVVGGRWSVPMGAALRDAGHDVVFALPGLDGPLPDLVRAEGLGLVRAASPAPGGPFRQPGGIRRFRRQLVDELRPDVVVSHLHASAVAGRLALLGTGVPHVYMPAGPLFLESTPVRFAERLLCRLDAHVVCTSEALRRGYRELGLPEARISVVPYGYDAAWASGAPADRLAARRQLGIDPQAFVVGCIALFYAPKRLVHRGRGIKGHDVLLEAWRRHGIGGGRGELLLVGSGFGPGGEAYREELRARFAAVPAVRWVDAVDDVRPWLAALDLNVTPSRSENLGGAAEASLLGCPTVASRVGGLPELVRDGQSGWLVPPDDPAALARAISRAEAAGAAERAELGRGARARALELFDLETNAARFVEVVEGVAAGGVGARG